VDFEAADIAINNLGGVQGGPYVGDCYVHGDAAYCQDDTNADLKGGPYTGDECPVDCAAYYGNPHGAVGTSGTPEIIKLENVATYNGRQVNCEISVQAGTSFEAVARGTGRPRYSQLMSMAVISDDRTNSLLYEFKYADDGSAATLPYFTFTLYDLDQDGPDGVGDDEFVDGTSLREMVTLQSVSPGKLVAYEAASNAELEVQVLTTESPPKLQVRSNHFGGNGAVFGAGQSYEQDFDCAAPDSNWFTDTIDSNNAAEAAAHIALISPTATVCDDGNPDKVYDLTEQQAKRKVDAIFYQTASFKADFATVGAKGQAANGNWRTRGFLFTASAFGTVCPPSPPALPPYSPSPPFPPPPPPPPMTPYEVESCNLDYFQFDMMNYCNRDASQRTFTDNLYGQGSGNRETRWTNVGTYGGAAVDMVWTFVNQGSSAPNAAGETGTSECGFGARDATETQTEQDAGSCGYVMECDLGLAVLIVGRGSTVSIEISFMQTGTNTLATLPGFYLSTYDLDSPNNADAPRNEEVRFHSASAMHLSSGNTFLTTATTSLGGGLFDYHIEAPLGAAVTNIDFSQGQASWPSLTSAQLDAMATVEYPSGTAAVLVDFIHGDAYTGSNNRYFLVSGSSPLIGNCPVGIFPPSPPPSAP